MAKFVVPVALGQTESNTEQKSTEQRMRIQVQSTQDVKKEGCIFQELWEGDTGPCVALVQKMLKRIGYYKGDITGEFDQETMMAVIKFQEDHEGLEPTGVVDQATWGVLLWYANPEEKCWIVPYIEGCEWFKGEQLRRTEAEKLLMIFGIGLFAYLILKGGKEK